MSAGCKRNKKRDAQASGSKSFSSRSFLSSLAVRFLGRSSDSASKEMRGDGARAGKGNGRDGG